MSEVTKNDLKQLYDGLSEKIEQQGIELRKEIKESADNLLEVVNAMAAASSNEFIHVHQKLDDISTELMLIKRQINTINSDIDQAFKSKNITEEETTALIAGQRRLERWIEQIAKETGIKLTA